VEAISLPAGKRVELKPGSFHIMLVGLTRALAAGDAVPLTLTIEEAGGKRTQVEVRAQVRPLGQ
jgi:copper(I)-binding protein